MRQLGVTLRDSMMGEFCILAVVVVTQICTCVEMTQSYTRIVPMSIS